MNEESIIPGDVVTLKSGGIAMTVSLVVEGLAYCTWFEADGRMSTGMFRLYMLKQQPPAIPSTGGVSGS